MTCDENPSVTRLIQPFLQLFPQLLSPNRRSPPKKPLSPHGLGIRSFSHTDFEMAGSKPMSDPGGHLPGASDQYHQIIQLLIHTYQFRSSYNSLNNIFRSTPNKMQAIASVWILKPGLLKQFRPKYLSMISDNLGYSSTTSPIILYSNDGFSARYCISKTTSLQASLRIWGIS
jgi:hypothetical protein